MTKTYCDYCYKRTTDRQDHIHVNRIYYIDWEGFEGSANGDFHFHIDCLKEYIDVLKNRGKGQK